MEKLGIVVNIIDILCTKPADLLIGEPPKFEFGKDSESVAQKAINRIVEENDITRQLHELTVGNEYRGDAWNKTYCNVSKDLSAISDDLVKQELSPKPIIETVPPCYIFPELANGSEKKFKTVNIAWVEYI
ncbi:hypothetical protein ACSVDA_21305 [Cytobacillus sp. Hm23]